MNLLCRYLFVSILSALSVGLLACQEKTETRQASEQTAPGAINPGMRAYVDPVTGEYAPAPAPSSTGPQAFIPGAAITTPTARTPQEVPLPKGGVMIELGDQFQTESLPAK